MPSPFDLGGSDEYMSLSKLAQPQQPPLPGGMAGLIYGQDRMQQQGFMQKAAQLAELSARMKAMQAEEASAGHEGRMSDIQTGNILSANKLGDAGLMSSTDTQTRTNANEEARTKAIKDALTRLAPWSNAWDKASPEQKPLLLKSMQDQNLKFGKTNISDLNPEDADKFMGAVRNALTNDEKYAIEGMKAKSRVDAATIGGVSRISAADIMAKARLAAAKAGIEAKQLQEPKTMEAEMVRLLNKNREKGLTEDEKDALEYMGQYKLYSQDVRGAGIKPTTSLDTSGNVKQTPPPLPHAPAIPAGKKAATLEVSDVDRIKQALARKGEKYEPDKYDYRINPQTNKPEKAPK